MDWTAILLFSLIGLIMGALAVKGYTQRIEPFLWLLFGLAVALVLSKNISERVFLHGLLIGLAWGILNGLCQVTFFDAYFANNPAAQASFRKVTFMPARLFGLITGPMMGLVTGSVLGGLSLLLKRLW